MVARILGPDGLGTIALLTAVAAMFGSVMRLNSAEATMVFTAKALADGDRVKAAHLVRYFHLTDLLTSLPAFSICALSAFFLPSLLNLVPGHEWLQVLYGLTLVFHATYWTSQAVLRILGHFSWIFYHSVGHSIVKTVLVALLFVTRTGLDEMVLLLVGLSLLDGITLGFMSWLAMRRYGVERNETRLSWWQVPANVRRFQLLGHGRQIIKSMNRYVDTLIMGYTGNPLQVGYFRSGKQIADQVHVPAQGLLVALFPEYSQLHFSKNVNGLRRLVGRFLVFFVLVAFLVSVVLWFGAEWIVQVVLGEDFAPAVPTLRVLMISAVILLAMSPLYSLPSAAGRAAPALQSVLAALGVQTVMILWLVPRYGALGAAWANVAYVSTWALVLTPSILAVLKHKNLDRCEEGPGELEPTGARNNEEGD
jgi:O-antigen/teichoic acid export membrane protein